MNTKKQFDLIIVYSGGVAHSAGDRNYREQTPFSQKTNAYIYNDSYKYFLLRCKKMGLTAAFTSSADIIGPGLFKSFWTYDRDWTKNSDQAQSKLFFHKFSASTPGQKAKLRLLTRSKNIYLFNDQKLKNIFQNKLNTYKNFKEFAIPTTETTSLSPKTILAAKKKLDTLLKKRKYEDDFNDNYIIKDKTGAGGYKIYKVNFKKLKSADFAAILKQYDLDKKKSKQSSYIIQPFLDCTRGFVFGKNRGLIDLRVIVLNRKIIQSYIRIAKPGNFRCNEHQGGRSVFISLNQIPQDVIAMTKKIAKQLQTKLNLKHSFYALDFIRSNNGHLYFIEGNDRPGLYWNPGSKLEEKKARELINLIVNELKTIIQEQKKFN
jgi:glutathione synthase/RimK-type ligase-like ATP-grasp enzyme